MERKRCIIAVAFLRSRRFAALGAGILAALLGLIGWAMFFRQEQPPAISSALKAASEGLTDYELTLRLIPQERTLAISETVRYRNDTGAPLEDLALRLWLNAFKKEETSPAALNEIYDACYVKGFSPGGVTLYDVSWNGAPAPYGLEQADDTVLRVSIPRLEPGEEGVLFLRCLALIPECAYRVGAVNGAYQLGNVIPLLSPWENGAWRTDEYHPIGDPFVSECANFHLTLDIPSGYIPACSAPLAQKKEGVWEGELPAARDIALCLYPQASKAQGRAGGVLVSVYAETEAAAKQGLVFARQALETFSSLYGPYPYPAFTLCAVDFPFSGMEYPGLCMIGKEQFLPGRTDSLELTVAHEAAHQWFYALVGSDQALSPWQDEALCEYAMLRYVRARYGEGSFEALKYYRADAPMGETIAGGLTPGSPITYFDSLSDYRTVVYGRGAALLLALDEFLPRGTDDFLRYYVSRFSYRLVTREEFDDCLNQYAGMDARPLVLDYLDTKMD